MKFENLGFSCLLAGVLACAPWTSPAKASDGDEVYQIAGHGFLAAVDCRKDGSPADYAEGVMTLGKTFGVPVSNRVGSAFSVVNAKDMLKRCGGAMAVFIVDDPALPMTLTASEERWAMINASKARAGNPDQKTLQRRLSLLFAREGCRVLGGDEVKGYSSCFHVVLGADDLDAITSFDITMGPEMSVRESMPLRGIVPPLFGTYEDACEMGLAPKPTNDVQRAIWEKVHAPPSKPIKITYDKDRQKPVVK